MIRLPRILLLGSTGRLGSQIYSALTDRLGRDDTIVAPTHAEFDLAKAFDGSNVWQDNPVYDLSLDVVINTVAYHDTKAIETDPKSHRRAAHLNSEVPFRLARAAHFQRFQYVHISTDYVFSGAPPRFDPRGYRPEDCPTPVNSYGITKLHGEYRIMAASPEASIVRVSSLFGSPPGVSDFVKLVRQKVKADEPMTVVDDVTMSPTYTREAGSALVDWLLDPDSAIEGTHHLCSGGLPVTWCEFAKAIVEFLGEDPSFITPTTLAASGDPVPRPASSALVCSSDFALPSWESSVVEYLALLDQLDTVHTL